MTCTRLNQREAWTQHCDDSTLWHIKSLSTICLSQKIEEKIGKISNEKPLQISTTLLNLNNDQTINKHKSNCLPILTFALIASYVPNTQGNSNKGAFWKVHNACDFSMTAWNEIGARRDATRSPTPKHMLSNQNFNNNIIVHLFGTDGNISVK